MQLSAVRERARIFPASRNRFGSNFVVLTDGKLSSIQIKRRPLTSNFSLDRAASEEKDEKGKVFHFFMAGFVCFHCASRCSTSFSPLICRLFAFFADFCG